MRAPTAFIILYCELEFQHETETHGIDLVAVGVFEQRHRRNLSKDADQREVDVHADVAFEGVDVAVEGIALRGLVVAVLFVFQTSVLGCEIETGNSGQSDAEIIAESIVDSDGNVHIAGADAALPAIEICDAFSNTCGMQVVNEHGGLLYSAASGNIVSVQIDEVVAHLIDIALIANTGKDFNTVVFVEIVNNFQLPAVEPRLGAVGVLLVRLQTAEHAGTKSVPTH